jgi:hypothetical protein
LPAALKAGKKKDRTMNLTRRNELGAAARKKGRMKWFNEIEATTYERMDPLPGDEMISDAAGTLTNAITLRCSREEVWPWLVQMGAGRAGWYSYDVLDNGGHHSAEQIIPELQNAPVGSIFPALPQWRDGFVLVESEPAHWLILGWPAPTRGLVVTWAFVLKKVKPDVTRLIVRARANDEYRFHGLPKAMGLLLARVVHFVMERKQLLEIARRVEGGQKGGARHGSEATK